MPTEDYFLSIKTVLRRVVLACIGKGVRGPYLQKSRDGMEDLWLNPGSCQSSNSTAIPNHAKTRNGDASTAAASPAAAVHTNLRAEDGDSPASSRAGPMISTKTVLLVKGKREKRWKHAAAWNQIFTTQLVW